MRNFILVAIMTFTASTALGHAFGRNEIRSIFLHINPGSNSNDKSDTVKPKNGDVALSVEVRLASADPLFIHVSKTAPNWYFEAALSCFKFLSMLAETKGNDRDQILLSGGLFADSVLPGADRKSFNENNLGYTCALMKN